MLSNTNNAAVSLLGQKTILGERTTKSSADPILDQVMEDQCSFAKS